MLRCRSIRHFSYVDLLLLIVAVSFGLFAVIHANAPLLLLVLINGATAAFAIYALRGIYFTLLDEQKVPAAATGTAAGIASLIGFMSDVYMPVLGGALLDRFPGITGYRLLFGTVAVVAATGAVAAWILASRNNQA